MHQVPVSATENVLRLDGLTVAAGGRTLLAGIDLALSPGERVGLRGPSGCGKTTLLRVINGLADPAAGPIATVPYTLVAGGDAVTGPSLVAFAAIAGRKSAEHITAYLKEKELLSAN